MKPILLFGDDANFLYFAKYKNDNAFLILKEKEKKIYTFKSKKELERKILNALKNYNAVGINFEISHKRFLWLKKLLRGKKLFDVSEFIAKKRAIKTKKEIKLIKKSAKFAEEIFEEIPRMLKKAKDEISLAKEMKKRVIDFGVELAFEPIVAFGKNSLQIHHKPTKQKFSKGKILLIDFGLKLNNYCSDITKCFALGCATKEMKITYEKVFNTFKNTKEMFLPNVNTSEILKRVKNLKMPHALAHSIGIDVHEKPIISKKAKGFKLKENMVFALEPATYEKKLGFGVRLESEVLVSKRPKIFAEIAEEIPILEF